VKLTWNFEKMLFLQYIKKRLSTQGVSSSRQFIKAKSKKMLKIRMLLLPKTFVLVVCEVPKCA